MENNDDGKGLMRIWRPSEKLIWYDHAQRVVKKERKEGMAVISHDSNETRNVMS